MSAIGQLGKALLSISGVIRYARGKRFIFCYHDVCERIDGPHSASNSTRAATFQEHIALIQSVFDIVPLEELVLGTSTRRNRAAITFDDGFKGVFTLARPILKAAKAPYSVFVNGGVMEHGQHWISNLAMRPDDTDYRMRMLRATHLSGSNPDDAVDDLINKGRFFVGFGEVWPLQGDMPALYMDRGEVAQLVKENVHLGDHGWDHCVLSGCDEKMLEDQLTRGKALLTDLLDEAPTHFAIPFGKKQHFDQASINALGRHGYKYVYTADSNRVRKADLHGEPAVIPRIGITDQTVQELLFFINRALIRHYDI